LGYQTFKRGGKMGGGSGEGMGMKLG